MKYLLYSSLFIILSCLACESSTPQNVEATAVEAHGNPHAEGFNLDSSDAEAVIIADEVMAAMGGYANWANTRYIQWNFFGSRRLLWDKHTGDVKVESLRNDDIMITNLKTGTGSAKRNGQLITEPDSLKPFLTAAKNAWINDSYWLVMPFKLKDSGVTLRYMGEDTTDAGVLSDVLSLTFEEVGITPQNKYHVFVDKTSRLVTQWQFFLTGTDPEPRFSIPWNNYKKHGNILLSGERGSNSLTEIQVMETVPENSFVLE